MCHKNTAEEIKGLCDRKKFVKLNAWTSVVIPHEIWQETQK